MPQLDMSHAVATVAIGLILIWLGRGTPLRFPGDVDNYPRRSGEPITETIGALFLGIGSGALVGVLTGALVPWVSVGAMLGLALAGLTVRSRWADWQGSGDPLPTPGHSVDDYIGCVARVVRTIPAGGFGDIRVRDPFSGENRIAAATSDVNISVGSTVMIARRHGLNYFVVPRPASE